MADDPLAMARAQSMRGGPFLFFDSGRGTGESYLFANHQASFSGRGSELAAWMREQVLSGRTVAGVLNFELGWDLDSIAAPRRSFGAPDAWVGAYDGPIELPEFTRTVEPEPFEPLSNWSPLLDVTAETYRHNVGRAVDAIWNGELFEVNYTERFRGEWNRAPFELYERMRVQSTGSYLGFAQVGNLSVASVSPEEFLRVDGRRVSTRPIKGTIRRDPDPAVDRAAANELHSSEKDRAENIMIVDLMRNDLTRFCTPGTVRATRICDVETFAGWHHLVSTVEGELDDGVLPTDLLVGAFPPGSITGAPKLRSIELIAELEASPRGPYTGTMFFADANTLRSNVLIRTATICNGMAQYGAGGAIVADSVPADEYDEALLKARPFLALGRPIAAETAAAEGTHGS